MGNILITKPFHVVGNVGHLVIKSFNDATFCLPVGQARATFGPTCAPPALLSIKPDFKFSEKFHQGCFLIAVLCNIRISLATPYKSVNPRIRRLIPSEQLVRKGSQLDLDYYESKKSDFIFTWYFDYFLQRCLLKYLKIL